MNAHRPTATLVIVTRNRRDHVLRALRSCRAQTHTALEVLLFDDASTDGTTEAVRSEFPSVRVFRQETQRGYIVLRNRSFREAQGEYVFSLDDDAYFTDPETVARTVALFESCPRAAAIALPYVEPSRTDASRLLTHIPGDRRLSNYVGCAHAVRKLVIDALGGYREFLVHQGEERDLCIRLLDRGYDIIYGETGPIVHLYSPNRDPQRVSFYGVRNTLLFNWLNVPQPYVFPRLAIDSLQLLLYKPGWKATFQRFVYLLAGWGACVQHVFRRRPVSRQTYRLFRSLPRHGPVPAPADGVRIENPEPVSAVRFSMRTIPAHDVHTQPSADSIPRK